MGSSAPMSALLASLVLTVGLLLVGVLLIVRGARGRRIDDDPYCRKCGFNLTGVWPRASTCPECGARLGDRGEVRLGARRRRKVPLVVGIVLVALVLGWYAFAVFASRSSFNWNVVKPTWVLMWQSENVAHPRTAGVLNELMKRYSANELGDDDLLTLADRGLITQADMTIPWLFEWGDVIELAWMSQVITDEQFTGYGRRTLATSFVSTQEITEDDHWPMSVRMKATRNGWGGQLIFRPRCVEITVDGESRRAPAAGGAMLGIGGGGGSIAQANNLIDLDLPVGQHVVATTWEIDVLHAGTFVGTWTAEDESTIDVLKSGTPLIVHNDDPDLGRQIHAAASLGASVHPQPGQPDGLRISFVLKDAPHAVAFDVIARDGEQEWSIGTIVAQSPTFATNIQNRAVGFKGKTVDVILRSNTQAARQTPGLRAIWQGELVFEDVEVDWSAVDAP